MNADELKERTKRLAIKIIQMIETLPAGVVRDVIGKQIIKAQPPRQPIIALHAEHGRSLIS